GLIAGRLQHGSERPLRCREAATLTLKRNGGHAAAVWDTPRLHGCAPRRAARLCIEGKENHTLIRQAVDVWRWHPSTYTATVGTNVPVADVVTDNQDNIGLCLLLCSRREIRHRNTGARCKQ